jgi:SAM-dependent methyltransferase
MTSPPKNFRPVALRRYPYPYRAALSVSNDTDGMDWAAFEDMHAFVSGTGQTPYGQGLGLEIGNSFWLWSDTASFSLHHTTPWDRDRRPSPESARIRELARSGWLDTLHSFGDWVTDYQLTRDDIAWAFDMFDALESRPPVYVNHGGGWLRAHNLGGAWATYQSGDDPDSESYNLSGLLERGFRFFWLDQFREKQRFGHDMMPERFPKGLPADSFARWMTITRLNARDMPGDVQPVFTDIPPRQAKEAALRLSNSLLVPALGRDGRAFMGFNRYRGSEGPTSATFPNQISAAHLDQLERGEGVCIVYQHLGIWRALGSHKGHRSHRESRLPILDENTVWSFRELAERQEQGRLFITTTGRLLHYLWLRKSLRFSVSHAQDLCEIVIHGTECPVYGSVGVAADDDLGGLTFLVDRRVARVVVRMDGGADLQVRRDHDPVDAEMDAVYLPWTRMEFPELAASPPRSLTGLRIGTPPPQQQRRITHRSLTPEQAKRMIDMISHFSKDDRSLRPDLTRIVENWHSIMVPEVLSAADGYIRKMHAKPFDTYLDRLRRLTGGGRTALDAGSGTATWCFPMAELFDHVLAVDKTRNRVDAARWLVEWSGNSRIACSYGDVTNLDCASESVDFVFCYGVIISSISLRAALREFRRVTRPGGSIYVCLNGIGWSYHLRDDRGQLSEKNAIQGRRGIYNTLCQTQQPQANARISQLLARLGHNKSVLKVCAALGWTSPQLVAFLESLINVKSLAEVRLPGDDAAPSPAELAGVVDRMLATCDLGDIPMRTTLSEIATECGSDFRDQFGLDLVGLLTGKKDGFSYFNSGRGYSPEEVETICKDVGLTGFLWAPEGRLVGFAGQDIKAPSFFGAEFAGRLGVWEFLVRCP